MRLPRPHSSVMAELELELELELEERDFPLRWPADYSQSVSQLPGMSRSSAPLRQHRRRERGGGEGRGGGGAALVT